MVDVRVIFAAVCYRRRGVDKLGVYADGLVNKVVIFDEEGGGRGGGGKVGDLVLEVGDGKVVDVVVFSVEGKSEGLKRSVSRISLRSAAYGRGRPRAAAAPAAARSRPATARSPRRFR